MIKKMTKDVFTEDGRCAGTVTMAGTAITDSEYDHSAILPTVRSYGAGIHVTTKELSCNLLITIITEVRSGSLLCKIMTTIKKSLREKNKEDIVDFKIIGQREDRDGAFTQSLDAVLDPVVLEQKAQLYLEIVRTIDKITRWKETIKI